MEFWEIVSVNMWDMCFIMLFLIVTSQLLLGRVPRRGIPYAAAGIFFTLSLMFMWAYLASVCFVKGVWHWPFKAGMVLWEYFQLAGCMVLVRFWYGASWKTCWAGTLLMHVISSFGNTLAGLLVFDQFYHLDVLSERQEYLFWLMIITPLCIFLCLLLVWKSGLGRLYGRWAANENTHGWLLVFLSLLPVISRILLYLAKIGQERDGENPMVSISMLLMVQLVFVYLDREEKQKAQIAQQQLSIWQQNAYIEQMEQMQTELRRFRHDFKNMMAGMYLQSREGEFKAIQSFIQEMTEDFNQQVDGQVRFMNQLANVHVVELKGLLLEHMTRMRKEDIHCELEALYPLEETCMRSTDLCRCLGILLDNAVEEVRGKSDGKVHIMISSLEACTTFRVKNTLYGAVDFGKLGTFGYSTKGENRGIGLSNYRKITEKYENILSLTSIEDGYFVQELKIQERR